MKDNPIRLEYDEEPQDQVTLLLLAPYINPNTEIDLTAVVEQLLIDSKVPANFIREFQNNNLIRTSKEVLPSDGTHVRPLVQRALLNNFFHLKLCLLPVDTMQARGYLIKDGEPIDWLKFFVSQVLPYFQYIQT
jgi:hypothetical protein